MRLRDGELSDDEVRRRLAEQRYGKSVTKLIDQYCERRAYDGG